MRNSDCELDFLVSTLYCTCWMAKTLTILELFDDLDVIERFEVYTGSFQIRMKRPKGFYI